MTATPGNLAVVPQNTPGSNPFNTPSYVSSRSLAANVAETITVPANATKVRLAGNVDFFYTMGAPTATAAVVPGDVDDGTSNELMKQQCDPEWRTCQGMAQISVITAAAGGGIVTASFYSN